MNNDIYVATGAGFKSEIQVNYDDSNSNYKLKYNTSIKYTHIPTLSWFTTGATLNDGTDVYKITDLNTAHIIAKKWNQGSLCC